MINLKKTNLVHREWNTDKADYCGFYILLSVLIRLIRVIRVPFFFSKRKLFNAD